ncbi:hypothetical protein TUMSATVNIG1_60720 (plasmid) [Vibrio nigripulchritudo]|uniref:hypothetical protein n=1 Tax=Vibrio nigripulchritudo TaxID=28173 RepID=UPI00190BEC2D|nr:hypothetical protein [Vibrio nigripulchritudo]BCL74088.1 hypothetical protein VNTUMSATTG_60250 [Vibrio nigripulchritudo]BDU35463.1 hypothetical protein TUMSATVNIG1_60720 [Vibrio nigripulchritudo]
MRSELRDLFCEAIHALSITLIYHKKNSGSVEFPFGVKFNFIDDSCKSKLGKVGSRLIKSEQGLGSKYDRDIELAKAVRCIKDLKNASMSLDSILSDRKETTKVWNRRLRKSLRCHFNNETQLDESATVYLFFLLLGTKSPGASRELLNSISALMLSELLGKKILHLPFGVSLELKKDRTSYALSCTVSEHVVN